MKKFTIYCGACDTSVSARGVGPDVHTVKEKRWLARGWGDAARESC